MIKTGDYIVQQTYPEDERSWYVHEVNLIDMGRFKTEEEAQAHLSFLKEYWK